MRTAKLEWLGLASVVLAACFEEGGMYGRPSHIEEVVLVRVVDEPPGDNCMFGGKAKHTGSDISGDGYLNDDEIVSTLYTCGCSGGTARLPPVCEGPRTLLHTRLDSDGDTTYTLLQAGFSALMALAPPADAGVRPRIETDDCILGRLPRSRVASSRCVGCHRERAASEIGRATGRLGLHPVGVDYDRARAIGRFVLRPRDELPVTVVLVDGRVECTTCHSARSTLPGHIATRRLCGYCHAR